MKISAWLVVFALGCTVASNLFATDRPPDSGDAAPGAAGNVEQDIGRQKNGAPARLQAAMGTFTVTGSVNAVAVTDEAVWAIVAVPQRLLPTHALIRSDIASGHAADLGNIGGFAGGDLVVAGGSVWAAEGLGGEKVLRIDPKTGKVIASIDVRRNPTALAYGAGAIWVAAADKVSRAGGVLLSVRGWALYRIDPATNQVVASVPFPTPEPPANTISSAMLQFASGALWAGDALTGTVVRIDPADNRVVATIEVPRTKSTASRRDYYSLHAVGDRLLLKRVGFEAGRDAHAVATDVTVWQIDPNANRLTGEPAQLVREGAILAFVDGVAWLGSTREDGLTRVDPITLQQLAEPIMVGNPVYALAGGRGSLLAIAGARLTAGDNSGRTWVTRVVP